MPVTDTGQGGTLARTHEGKPGLPRGRSRLPLTAVRASQRERLLRSVIAAVSESGYLAVTAGGRDLMIAQIVSATRALPADACDEEVLRAACRVFLAFLAGEPAFARVFYIHMPTAGPRAMDRLDAAPGLFANLNRLWHERAREHHPEWPSVPAEAYLALAGATVQLVRSVVRAGRTDDLPGLEETLVPLHLAVLAARPWPQET